MSNENGCVRACKRKDDPQTMALGKARQRSSWLQLGISHVFHLSSSVSNATQPRNRYDDCQHKDEQRGAREREGGGGSGLFSLVYFPFLSSAIL